MNDYWHEDFFDSLNKMIPVKENNITYQMYAYSPLANFDINSGEFSKKFRWTRLMQLTNFYKFACKKFIRCL